MWSLTNILLLVAVIRGVQSVSKESDCMFHDSCEQCLSTHINCSWCTDKHYEVRYRCLTRLQLLEFGCNSSEIYENEPQLHALKDTPVKDYETVNDRAVQVQPQKLYVKLVKSHPQRIKLTYRAARNNPLDLYFLMDLTWTMRDDKETLVQLGAELSEALRNLTTNYRLGFGSFADKPAMPMVMPQLTENPCAPEHEVCEPTYGYRHHLPLTQHVREFVRSVNESRITANLDNLEGGLDALMQVLVCPVQIGWKEEARKIVILVTDGFMHFAGDGLLAGITKRNDKQCHMSAEGEYTGSLEFDYPSLEEIYRELLRRKISVIFAVTSGVANTYLELSALMKEISNVEILRADSSNILELIKKSYETFIKRAQFTDNSPSYIQLDYESDCGGQTNGTRKRNYCNNVEMGKEVDFYVTLTLKDFPTDGVYTQRIRIEEATLNEYLELEVEIQKPCPCTGEPADVSDEYGRFQCSEQGYMECGMCACDEGWSGTFCNCPVNGTNDTTTAAIEKQCRQPIDGWSDELASVCWNRGECDCGTCVCFPGFAGKYCECPECDYCDSERADCVCGQCVCKYGWSGNDCSCNSKDIDGCIGPTGEICSVRGECECNECVCSDSYTGRFCEIDSETENKLCAFFEPCVTCVIQQKLGLNVCENLTEVCSSAEERMPFSLAFVSQEIDDEVRCLVRLENKHQIKCDHYYTYQSLGPAENYLVIQVNICDPVDYYALGGFVSATTFLLGLLLICFCWGILRIKDAREYARFEQDQRNSVLMESPLYKDPIGRYKVPQQIKDDPFYE